MCKTLREGGPCYSHLRQRIDTAKKNMEYDARQQGAALGIAVDSAALSNEQRHIAENADVELNNQNRVTAEAREEASIMGSRGKKLQEKFNAETFDAVQEKFRRGLGEDHSPEMDVAFTKTAMAESLLPRVETLEADIEKQRSLLARRKESGKASPEAISSLQRRIERLEKEMVITNTRKSELEEEASVLFKGKENAGSLARRLSQGVTSSAEYMNAVEQFSKAKERAQDSSKEATAIRRRAEKEMKRSQELPPLSKVEFEAFKSNEYPGTESGAKYSEQLAELDDEISQTNTAIREMREFGERLGGLDTPSGRKILSEANHHAIRKAIRVGQAQGKSPAEIQQAIAQDAYVSMEKEHNAKNREPEEVAKPVAKKTSTEAGTVSPTVGRSMKRAVLNTTDTQARFKAVSDRSLSAARNPKVSASSAALERMRSAKYTGTVLYETMEIEKRFKQSEPKTVSASSAALERLRAARPVVSPLSVKKPETKPAYTLPTLNEVGRTTPPTRQLPVLPPAPVRTQTRSLPVVAPRVPTTPAKPSEQRPVRHQSLPPRPVREPVSPADLESVSRRSLLRKLRPAKSFY